MKEMYRRARQYGRKVLVALMALALAGLVVTAELVTPGPPQCVLNAQIERFEDGSALVGLEIVDPSGRPAWLTGSVDNDPPYSIEWKSTEDVPLVCMDQLVQFALAVQFEQTVRLAR